MNCVCGSFLNPFNKIILGELKFAVIKLFVACKEKRIGTIKDGILTIDIRVFISDSFNGKSVGKCYRCFSDKDAAANASKNDKKQ